MLVTCSVLENLVTLLLLICSKSAALEDKLWIREPTFDNRSSVSGYDVISRNRIHCGWACSMNTTCFSFFFIPDLNLNCKLLSMILSSTHEFPQLTIRAYYYILDGVSTTTSTTTTTTTTTPPPTFSCPPDDTIFRTVLLDDGDHFTYKVAKQTATHSNAKAGCAAQGSFLTRVTTVAKMNMLLQLTRTCAGYNDIGGYYVDGSNADAVDFFAPGAWVMANGDPVPMSTDFWSVGGVAYPESKHCFRMRASENYLWDDCLCSNAYSYICEK